MARLSIPLLLLVILPVSYVLRANATRLSEAAIEERRAERQKLVRDVESVSDNHKRAGKSFTEVRTLLHKYLNLASQKHGVHVQFDGEIMQKALPQFDDGTEMSKNRNIAADLFENDMVLTLEQVQTLVDKIDTSARDAKRKRRKLVSNDGNRWPNARIPYRFAEEDDYWQDVIRSAIRHWESETCIRFTENGVGDDHVQFFKGDGCYSMVGRTGGAQQISIGEGCELMAIIAHEIGHTLGFWHEQSRPDRDEYITINMNNMIPGTQGQVSKRDRREINYYDNPYDLGSVMHYGPKAFTSDADLLTLTTDDSKYQNTIGQRARLSFIDAKQVNKAYCSDKCPVKLGCKNSGYENPNDCSECKCPEGLGGKLCDEVQPSDCGADLTATSQWQTLSYSDRKSCYWRIKSNSVDGKIRFEVTSVSYQCRATCTSYVEIKHNDKMQQTGFRLCCEAIGGQIVSAQNFILVISNERGNFEMRYKSEGDDDPTPTPTATPTDNATPIFKATRTTTSENGIETTDATTRHVGSGYGRRTTTTEFPAITPADTPEPTQIYKNQQHRTTTMEEQATTHHHHHYHRTTEPPTTQHDHHHHRSRTTTSSDYEF